MRILCVGYCTYLTLLLLSEQPAYYVPASGGLLDLLRWASGYAHLLSFGLLSVLVLGARWPVPQWGLVTIMIAYGAASELLQGLTPTRTPDWADWFQDVAGVLLGLVACWVAAKVVGYLGLRLRGDPVPATGKEF